LANHWVWNAAKRRKMQPKNRSVDTQLWKLTTYTISAAGRV
jgi:hypothetical protein